MKPKTWSILFLAVAALLSPGWLEAAQFPSAHTSGWELAVEAPGINTPAMEGCPIETPDGLSLMIASTREGGFGALDIWAADRPTVDSAWGPPANLGATINSEGAEFCPMPSDRYLFFVANPAGIDACGGDGGDMYVSRQSPTAGWSEPALLGCHPAGPNTAGGERSPSFVETPDGTFLFYSTNGPGGDSDIFVSRLGDDGHFGPGQVVTSLSTPSEDMMPNVRARDDGKYEIVFNSTRPTWGPGGTYASFGGNDVYSSTIPSPDLGNWSEPLNLGPNVNTAGQETRATLSGDGQRLNFGRDGDIYTSHR